MVAEDEMAGCHHRLNGHEFEQLREINDRGGGLPFPSPMHESEK